MPIIISDIRIGIDENERNAIDKAVSSLGVKESDIRSAKISKKSIDARRRDRITFVCSVAVSLKNEEAEPAVADSAFNAVYRNQSAKLSLKKGTCALAGRPVIAGFGPAGMFAALVLAREGYRPIVLERGADVASRSAAVESFFAGGELKESNVQFGEGGAGTFSDGKLTTRINDSRCEYVLREFVSHGAPEEILYKAKPHLGTDNLKDIVARIREEIISLGGEVRFNTAMDGVSIESGKLRSVCAMGNDIETSVLVVAIGHSARDTFAMLSENGVAFEPKPFSVGVRIEHLQRDIDRAMYKSLAGHPALPPAEYQLSYRMGGRAVYTFCMCPGGVVVPAASEQGGVVTNGMSYFKRDGENANSAVVVSVGPEQFGNGKFDGIELQRRLERAAFSIGGEYRAPMQTVGSLLGVSRQNSIKKVIPTYHRGGVMTDLSALFDNKTAEMLRVGLTVFDSKIHGFADPEAVLTGVETRTSSPVRMIRRENFESLCAEGLYPCGEGAGYAGGIMSAAVDGIRIAEAIISKYKPF